MRMYGVLVPTLLATAILFPASLAVAAANDSPYLLQEHGTVRIIRGLQPGKNFETAKLPKETGAAPAAGEEPQAKSSPGVTQVVPEDTGTKLGEMGTQAKTLQ